MAHAQRELGYSREQIEAMTEQDLRRELLMAKARLTRHVGNASGTQLAALSDNPKWDAEQLNAARGYVKGVSKLGAEIAKANSEKYGSSVSFTSGAGFVKPVGPRHTQAMQKWLGMAGHGTGIGGDYLTIVALLAKLLGFGKTEGAHKKSIQDALAKYNADPNNTEKYQAKWSGSWLSGNGSMQIVDAKGKPAPLEVTQKIAGMAMGFAADRGYTPLDNSSIGSVSPGSSKVSATPSTQGSDELVVGTGAIQPPAVGGALTVRGGSSGRSTAPAPGPASTP